MERGKRKETKRVKGTGNEEMEMEMKMEMNSNRCKDFPVLVYVC